MKRSIAIAKLCNMLADDQLGPLPSELAAGLVADGQAPLFGEHDAALVAEREQIRERQRAPLFG